MREESTAIQPGLQPVRWLAPASALVAVGLFCVLAAHEDLQWILWALAIPAVVGIALFRWPCGAILVLAASSAMPHLSVEVFGWNARPEHFAGAIIFLTVVAWAFVYKRRLELDKLDYWIAAFVVINYLSSLLGSSQPLATLKWAIQNNLAVLPYFLIRWTLRDPETLRRAFRIFLIVGVVEASYGIVCYLSNRMIGSTVGMSIGMYLGDVAAPYGSLYEPNLFGAYTGCSAVLFLSRYLVDRRRRWVSFACFVVCSLGAILSFSRAALLALVAAATWLMWKTIKAGRLQSKPVNQSGGLALAFGLVLLLVASMGSGVFQERFGNLYYQGLTEETTLSRFIVIEEALLEIPQHPLLGSGTASFNLSFDWANYDLRNWQTDRTWISNATVRVLHDCGLFGIIALLGFFISVWWKIRPAMSGNNALTGMLLGLVGGTLVYAISFQSTDGSILAFSWVHLGFLASTAVIMGNRGQRLNRTTELAGLSRA